MGLRVTRHAAARWRERVGHGDLVEAWQRSMPVPVELERLVMRRGYPPPPGRLLYCDEPQCVLIERERWLITVYVPSPGQLIALRRWARQLEAA